MKFAINPKEAVRVLREVVKSPQKGVGKRSQFMQIDAKDGEAVFTANMMSAGIPAEVEKPGSCRLKYSKLLPVIKLLAKNKTLLLEITTKGMTIGKVFIPAWQWQISLTNEKPSLDPEPENSLYYKNQLKLQLD